MLAAKFRAALIHGSITVVVALLTASIVFGVWYPGEFAAMAQGTGLYRLVLGVEVILGPVMSLVVFSTQKARTELVRDYLVIGLVQAAALVFGLYSVAASRPVYLVFVKDRIELVAATELTEVDLQDATGQFRSVSWWGPKLICVDLPQDPIEKSDLLMSALKGKDVQLYPKYYRDCRAGEVEAKVYKKDDLERLAKIKVHDLPAIVRDADFSWLPVVTRFGAWTVIYENSSVDKPVYVNVDPFSHE